MAAKRFRKGISVNERAVQIWQILVCRAMNKQLMTYKELSKILGFGGPGVLGQFLGPIMWYCDKHSIPPLTTIVVNEGKGRSGIGLTTTKKQGADRIKVYKFNWFRVVPPSADDFSNA